MLIGITGSLGGGKGTLVNYLSKNKDFKHYSSSDLLIKILEERGDVVDRDGMNRVANELRASNPAGVPAETYKQYEADGSPENAIFEALHSVPEAEFIKSKGGVVLAITADPDQRYNRIKGRKSVKDNVSREEFVAQQQREELGSGDPNKSNIFDVIKIADHVIENNRSLHELRSNVDIFLDKYKIRNL
jgi:dephospho-CoA kinase